MKKSVTTLVLFIMVVILWGLIIVKVYKGFTNNNHQLQFLTPPLRYKNIDTPKASFVLHTYTRDPFLSILTDTGPTTLPHEKAEITPPKKIEKQAVILPSYCGILKNGKEKLAILYINKKTFFIKQGETIFAFRLKSITDSNITLINQGVSIRVALKKRER